MPKFNLESTELLEKAITHISHNRRQGNKLIAKVRKGILPTSALGILKIYSQETAKTKKNLMQELAKIRN